MREKETGSMCLRRCGCLFLLVCGTLAFAQPSQILIRPTPTTVCTPDGLARANVSWTGPLSQSYVYVQDGDTRTLFSSQTVPAVSGNAFTGDWLRDGLQFLLTDSSGQVLAQARAVVRCTTQQSSVVSPQASGPSYVPLQVGNRWVYRLDNRSATALYLTRQVTGTRLIGSQTWYTVTDVTSAGQTEMLWRNDDAGRLYQLNSGADGTQTEQLVLDPNQVGSGPALYQVEAKIGSAYTPVGDFADALYATRTQDGILLDQPIYARSIGLVSRTESMISGSSGGLVESWELVSLNLSETVALQTPARQIALAVEDDEPSVSTHQVSNCAIPCYFVACSVGGADPAGTYKPCLQSRLSISDPSLSAPNQSPAQVTWKLTAPGGAVVYTAQQSTPTYLVGGEWLTYLQVPLYSAPNQPFPPGEYVLQSTVQLANGRTRTATVPITLK